MKLNLEDKRQYNFYKNLFSIILDDELCDYNKIVSESAKIIKELGMKNNFDSYFYIFYYLLSKGYFSYNHEFLYGIPDSEAFTSLGLSIPQSKGVCRNICSFMQDVFDDENLGYKTYLVSTNRERIPKNDIGLRIKVDRDSIKEINEAKSYEYNHMELLTKLGDDYYLYDPTNLAISIFNHSIYANVKDIMSVSSIHVFNLISRKKMLNLSRDLKFKRISYIHNKSEYNFVKDNTLYQCSTHTDMLEDFNREIQKYMVLK